MPPDTQILDAFAKSADHAAGRDNLPDEAPSFARDPFRVDDMNDKYFRKILELGKEYGVEIFWFTMPTPTDVKEARSKIRYEEDMLTYLRQFEARGELHILRGEFVTYPDALFGDSLHLTAAGAIRLACELEEMKGPIIEAAMEASSKTSHAAESPAGDKFAEQLRPLCPSDLRSSAY